LGNRPREIERLDQEAHAEAERLNQSLPKLMAVNRSFAKWCSKLDEFNRKLEQTTGVDPALIAKCQEEVLRLRDSGQVGDLTVNLRKLHREIRLLGTSSVLRHSEVWGLISRLESSSPLPAPPGEPIRELEAQRHTLHLSDAIIAACEGFFRPIEKTDSAGTAALASWHLRTIDRGSHPPVILGSERQ
jgi:hypothetical protein